MNTLVIKCLVKSFVALLSAFSLINYCVLQSCLLAATGESKEVFLARLSYISLFLPIQFIVFIGLTIGASLDYERIKKLEKN